MREKARLFRALLLEPLECRTVFAAEGLDIWQCVHPSSGVEFNQSQSAQLLHTEHALATDGAVSSNAVHRGIQAGQRSRGTSQHGHVFDCEFDRPLPPAEGEGRLHADAPRFNFNPPSHIPNQPSGQPNGQPNGPRVLPNEPRVAIAVDAVPNPIVFSPPRDLSGDNIPRAQVELGGSNSGTSRLTTITGNNSIDQVPTSATPNSVSVTRVVSTSVSVAQANLVAQNFLAVSAGTTTFDFSAQPTIASENFTLLGSRNQRTGEYHFTKPPSLSADAIFDPTLLERATGVASLENLLSDLAENHRRNRTQNEFDTNQPNTRSEQNWRPEQNATSVAISFADGGMIALALNRDKAFAELEDMSEVGLGENRAWVSYVGIYRAFENGAVAATEYARLANRISSNTDLQSTKIDWSEVESEVANTQLHSLLASTSAALGLAMFGLRRLRKSVPLIYTIRKR